MFAPLCHHILQVKFHHTVIIDSLNQSYYRFVHPIVSHYIKHFLPIHSIIICFLYIPQIFNLCCCLPTPMTLASGGSPMFPRVVHQPASPSIWPAEQLRRRGPSTNPGVTMWCICECSWRDDVCRVCVCYRGGIVVMEVIWHRLCVNMKGDLFVLSWARVRRVRRGSISSELLMCGGRVRSILLLPLVSRCLGTIDVCIWRMFVFMYVVVTVCGLWEVCCVAAVVKDSVFFSLAVLKYGVCLCKGCDGCCVFCLYCDVWSCTCSCMGSMSVSSCRCCSLCASCGSSQCCVLHDLQFVDAGRGCKRRPHGRGMLQKRYHDCLIGSHKCLRLFTPSCCCECFYHL